MAPVEAGSSSPPKATPPPKRPAAVAPRGRIPDGARKLATVNKGRAAYARRTVGDRRTGLVLVLRQMATLQNAKHLLLRGLDDQARGEWLLLAACHNLRKLHGHIGINGLAALPVT